MVLKTYFNSFLWPSASEEWADHTSGFSTNFTKDPDNKYSDVFSTEITMICWAFRIQNQIFCHASYCIFRCLCTRLSISPTSIQWSNLFFIMSEIGTLTFYIFTYSQFFTRSITLKSLLYIFTKVDAVIQVLGEACCEH